MERKIQFHVGDVQHSVPTDGITPETTLNTYLRDISHLTATKKMCLEGGCGTCIVAVEHLDSKGNKRVFAVNSCLVSIYSCHGWKILSNEGIGNPTIGYHKIQKILADNNGSQCGFCSSGMVMNMYALLGSGDKTQKEIENSFGGNLCRCTGYRPILTAFKLLASDAYCNQTVTDLEDIGYCINNPSNCQKKCSRPCTSSRSPVTFKLKNTKWMKFYNLKDVLETLDTYGTTRYMLVAGNTARGVYWLTPATTPEIYMDISVVAELTSYSITDDDRNVILGGNMNLTDTMELFRKIARANSGFVYLDAMAAHIDLVAHVPVRNIGTLAGNLMTKHQHNEFPSDIFLILETVNATLLIVDTGANETRVSPNDFLHVNMTKKVIKQIILPAYGKEYYFTSYKIMPRAQNAHAMVNAGFLFKLSDQTTGIVQEARIVYGGINPQFVHATKTELLLKGKPLFDNNVLQLVFKSLDAELNPDWVLPDPSPPFRKKLAINLFYKCVLSIAPPTKISARNKSGGTLLTRPVSSGTQQIYSQKDLYPLTEPVPKLEALAQTSGNAKYILDMPDLPGQLYGYFVTAQAIAGSEIVNIDADEALKSPGAVAFFTANDIPGVNSIAVTNLYQTVAEPIFSSGKVQYYYQPVGLLVATSHDEARTAASLVKVGTTPPSSAPIFTIKDVLKLNAQDRITHQTSFVPKTTGTDIKYTIKGNSYVNTQYHFHMENQICMVVPTEDGLNVFAGTQWMDHIQGVIAQVLNMPSQKINVFVRRLGGAFGAKISRNAFLAAASALAADKLQRPVRMWMNLENNMDVMGKRYPLYTDYEVKVNAEGVIQSLEAKLYSDLGLGSNEAVDTYVVAEFQNCYGTDTWGFDTYSVITDNCSNCSTRAPGTFEGLATIENIMDHIAYTLNADPLAVREANMDKIKYAPLVNALNEVKKSAQVAERKQATEDFNKANKWKKRGMSIVPMRWTLEILGTYTTIVSIYHLDGGVAVSHGGIEIGQGINTKVAQVCSYKFGIPLEKVSIKPSYNVISPNCMVTGGSFTSESVVYSLIKACDILLDRIKPVRDQNPDATWEQLITLCFSENINLSSSGFYYPDAPGLEDYPIYGVCVLELETDILTGKYEILRVDIVEDVGRSMSPLIDIGQLEGGFIMGLGAHSTEELVYDDKGKLVTDRTWTYKPPGAKDIPQIFNVSFLNNSFNPVGVLKSKATGEPTTCLSAAFPFAIRNALASARREVSPSAFPWYSLNGPSTVEQNLLSSLTEYQQFTL